MLYIRKSANSLLFLYIISIICSTVNSFQDFQCQTQGPCSGGDGGDAVGTTQKTVSNTNCDAGGGAEYKFTEREFSDEYLEKFLHLKGKLLDMPISICKEQNKETTKKVNLELNESCDQSTQKSNDLDVIGEGLCNNNQGTFQTIPIPTTEDKCKGVIVTTPAPTKTKECETTTKECETTTEKCVTTTEKCVTTTEACATTTEKCVTTMPTTTAVECIETTTEADCMEPTTVGTTPDCIAPTISTKAAECIESTTTELCGDLPDDNTKSKNSTKKQNDNINSNSNRSTDKKDDAKLEKNSKELTHTNSTGKSKDTRKLGFAGHMLQLIKDILLLKSQGKEEKSSYDETNDDLDNKKLSSIQLEEIENLLKATKDFDRALRASLEQPSLKRYRRNRHRHGRHKKRKRKKNSHKNAKKNHRKGQKAAKLRQKKTKGRKLRKYYKYNVEVDRGEIWPTKREENVRHLFL